MTPPRTAETPAITSMTCGGADSGGGVTRGRGPGSPAPPDPERQCGRWQGVEAVTISGQRSDAPRGEVEDDPRKERPTRITFKPKLRGEGRRTLPAIPRQADRWAKASHRRPRTAASGAVPVGRDLLSKRRGSALKGTERTTERTENTTQPPVLRETSKTQARAEPTVRRKTTTPKVSRRALQRSARVFGQ